MKRFCPILAGALIAIGVGPMAAAASPYSPNHITPSIAPAVDAEIGGDYAGALRLLKPLADAGDINAQIQLAELYGTGKGIPKDAVTGEAWCMIALSRIPGPASARADTAPLCNFVKISMTAPQLAAAQSRAQAWRPTLPPGARAFLIFFDFEMPNMTAEAQKVADVAVLDAINSGATRIEITGHTDTLEDNPAELSLARANLVRSFLLQKGVPDSVAISVLGVGAHELIVPIGPRVREPQDRFVSVVVH